MRFFAAQVFDGQQMQQNMLIDVQEGRIVDMAHGQASQAQHAVSGLLCPGFIDVQVNGGGGVLFNNSPSLEALTLMTRAHQSFGTTAMLPTLITDDIATMREAADAVSQAIQQNMPGVIGVHFEGPHLSVPKKGIHPDSHIRPVSDAELALFLRKDLGQVLITVAPENVSVDIIQELVGRGVKVCLGHSNASAQQTQAALKAGASGFTHLYNAMSPLHSREAGMLGTALLDQDSYAGLIVDNEHVSCESAQLAIKCKGSARIMLVTDAMSQVGSEDDELLFAGMQINRHGNKLSTQDGRLAGSALDMASAVRNTHQTLQIPLQQALQMAALTPATFLGAQHERGLIQKGMLADWVVLDHDLHAVETIIAGQIVA